MGDDSFTSGRIVLVALAMEREPLTGHIEVLCLAIVCHVVNFIDLAVISETSFQLHQFLCDILRQVWRGFTSGRMVLVDLAMERDYPPPPLDPWITRGYNPVKVDF